VQKSNRIECRVTDLEKADWQKAAGGSRRVSEWLRGLANAECERLRRGEDEHTLPPDAPTTSAARIVKPFEAPNAKPLIVADAIEREVQVVPPPRSGKVASQTCPRAHHHRPGRYCGTCKKVATKVGE
jgi:hypothetical protein